MANRKKEVYRPGPMTEGKRNIIQGLLQEYNIESANDIQEALKDLLCYYHPELTRNSRTVMSTSRVVLS